MFLSHGCFLLSPFFFFLQSSSVSSVGIMIFELAYFLDTLLSMCLPWVQWIFVFVFVYLLGVWLHKVYVVFFYLWCSTSLSYKRLHLLTYNSEVQLTPSSIILDVHQTGSCSSCGARWLASEAFTNSSITPSCRWSASCTLCWFGMRSSQVNAFSQLHGTKKM